MVKQRKREINLRVSLPTVGKNKQVLRVIVWGIFGLMLLISLLSMVRYGAVLSRLSSVEQELTVRQKSTKVDAPPRLTLYMNEFIPRYIHITPEDSDKRTKELASYFGEGLRDTTATKDAKRVFKQATLFDVKDGVASYIVEYINQAMTKTASATTKMDAKGNKIPGVKEIETTSEHAVKSLLNIPYQEKDGQYAVVGLPYFTAIPKLHASLPLNEEPLSISTSSHADTQTSEAVSDFVDDFLRKYTTQSASDMSYMMRKPASIKGLYEYVSANKIVKLEDNKLVAYVDAQFREKSASIEHIERMKLVLAKQDNKYVVTTLTYRGGK